MVVNNTGYFVFLCDTVTGKFTRSIPISKLGWGVRLNGAGPVTATVPVSANEVSEIPLRQATTLVRQSLGIAYNGVIQECGPLWGRAYDPVKEEMQLTASGLWSLFDRRKVLPGSYLAAGQSPTKAVLTISNKSLGSIARELVRISIQDNPWIRPDGTNGGSLNIVLPADVAGTNTRTYFGYDLASFGTRLNELTQVDNGPDIRFRPRFNGTDPTIVEWVMETGNDTNPLLTQTGADWYWDGSVPDSPVVGFGVAEDATGMAARAWAPGSGTGTAMQLAYATDTTLVNLGWPWTETDTASKSVITADVLQGHANRQLADGMYPWAQWSLQVRTDAVPTLDSYNPGEWAQVVIPPGHPMIDPGAYRVRIIAKDGDDTFTTKITVAPIQSINGGTGVAVSHSQIVSEGLSPSSSLYPTSSTYPQGELSDFTYVG